MKTFKIVLVSILIIAGLVGLSYGFGWIGVHQTKTIHKAQQNAEREVFEQTQSYIEAKRQEALKMYREYNRLTEDLEKYAIENYVANSFANFDEEKLSGEVKEFVKACKR